MVQSNESPLIGSPSGDRIELRLRRLALDQRGKTTPEVGSTFCFVEGLVLGIGGRLVDGNWILWWFLSRRWVSEARSKSRVRWTGRRARKCAKRVGRQ